MSKTPPTLGGGFSYQERLIEAIDAHGFHPSLEICFVGRIPSDKVKMQRKYVPLASRPLYRFFYLLDRFGLIRFISWITSFNWNIANRVDRSILRQNNIDLILYPKQSHAEVLDFPFITMNWDVGHRSTYAFPEFILDRNLELREAWYDVQLKKAFAVFTESEHGKREMMELCHVPAFKIHVIPMFPGRVVDLRVEDIVQQGILEQYQLKPQQYFYYPAQYWAHKNHYNLLQAFRKIRTASPSLKIVFSGADYGNKEYIRSVARELELTDAVVMLGFVKNEEVFTFYRHSAALVMPSFLGPTNMPLLEAQALETAVICSDFEGHRELCGDGALYVKPEDPGTIADAMLSVLDSSVRSELISKANAYRATSIFNIKDALRALNDALVKLVNVRKVYP